MNIPATLNLCYNLIRCPKQKVSRSPYRAVFRSAVCVIWVMALPIIMVLYSTLINSPGTALGLALSTVFMMMGLSLAKDLQLVCALKVCTGHLNTLEREERLAFIRLILNRDILCIRLLAKESIVDAEDFVNNLQNMNDDLTKDLNTTGDSK